MGDFKGSLKLRRDPAAENIKVENILLRGNVI